MYLALPLAAGAILGSNSNMQALTHNKAGTYMVHWGACCTYYITPLRWLHYWQSFQKTNLLFEITSKQFSFVDFSGVKPAWT